MKKYLPLILIAAFVIATAATNEAQKSFATVNREHGLYIFTDSKPNSDYELISTITAKSANVDLTSFNATGLSYDELKTDVFKQLDKKKNEKKYSGGEALIFYPDEQRADLIKFK